jgi:hypothetical protein
MRRHLLDAHEQGFSMLPPNAEAMVERLCLATVVAC